MIESFRWYGNKDLVSLADIMQSGATNVVSALHEVKNGHIWEIDNIKSHQNLINKSGLDWGVVESVPIHEDIKLRRGNFKLFIKNYKKTLENLASCQILTVCYNFMPVLDWTRTHLFKKLKDGSTALAYEINAMRAFDLFILKRPDAQLEYSPNEIDMAYEYYNLLKKDSIEDLIKNIIAGLPGSEEGYSFKKFKKLVQIYKNISKKTIQNNLLLFLEEIIPVAEDLGIKMCIHPDDPPHSLFGIPRVVSSSEDLEFIFSRIPSLSNGLTFCSGSLGINPNNDLLKIFKTYASRIHFIHFRSTKRDERGNFIEANHLEGDVDMFSLVKATLEEEEKRRVNKRFDTEIPMRPDHGHQMLDDLNKNINPGYSAIGRLKGLAELRGLSLGIKSLLFE